MVDPVKIHKQYIFVASVFVVAILLLFVIFMGAVRSNGVSPQQVRFDKGWTVTYKGEKTPIMSLRNFTFPKRLMNGDTLILEGSVPANSPIAHPVFRFKTTHCAVEVFENGKSLYEYGKDSNFPGSGYHYVYLDPSEVQKLKVVLVEKVDNRIVHISNYSLLPNTP